MQNFIQSETFKKHVEITQQFDSLLEENEIEIYKPLDSKFDFTKYQQEVSKDHPIEDLTQMYNELKSIITKKEETMTEIRKHLTQMALAFQNLKGCLDKEYDDNLQITECLNYIVERMVDETEGTVSLDELMNKRREIRQMKIELPEMYTPQRVFKQTSKHVVDVKGIAFDMKPLQEWTNMNQYEIIYDTEKNGVENKTFNEAVLNKKNIAVTYIDEKGNVFGYYTKNGIDCVGKYSYDKDHFLFSLKKEEFSTGKQFFLTEGKKSGFLLREDDEILTWVGNSDFGFACYKPGMKHCFCRKLSLIYDNLDDIYLNDTNYPIEYETKMVVVIQMK